MLIIFVRVVTSQTLFLMSFTEMFNMFLLSSFDSSARNTKFAGYCRQTHNRQFVKRRKKNQEMCKNINAPLVQNSIGLQIYDI